MNIINLIKDRIESKLNIDFNSLQYPEPLNLPENDTDVQTLDL